MTREPQGPSSDRAPTGPRRGGLPELVDEVVDGALAMLRHTRRSPDEKLLDKARRKRRAWAGHLRSYLTVVGGLGALNLILAVSGAGAFPWSLIVAASWGIGLAMHGLGHRAWQRDHAAEIAAAEARLGRTVDPPRLPPLPSDPWDALAERCRRAVAAATEALAQADAGEAATFAPRRALEEGLRDVERLTEGARRMERALAEVAPDGAASLDARIRELDRQVAETSDARLQEVYAANRGLLQARRLRVQQLASEIARMWASAEGFALAAENARLDATRLGAVHLPALATSLREPLQRLDEEVEILQQVEAELERL